MTHCINRAIALTGMARDAVQRATTDPSCCFLFTKWFGVPEPRRVSKVLDNFARLHGAIAARPMVLFYRGPKIAPTFPDDEPGGQGYIVKPEPKIFAETFGSRNGVGPPPFSPNRTYIWLGGLFFDEQRSTSRSGFDSQAGVFIHELSHAFCDTDDVDWKGYSAYGQDTCQEIALEDPDLAVKNADNYEYFAEEFQVNLYDEDGQFERNAARAAAAGSQIRSHSSKPAFKNCSTRSQVKSLAGRAQRSPWTIRG